MADISREIEDFRSARKGKDVRGSMISLAEKVNKEVEGNTVDATAAARNANAAAETANNSADKANSSATNANNAAKNAQETRQDILNKLVAGEFKGDQGEKGEKGEQGESGVMAPSSGMFSLFLDPATGDLYAEYPTGEMPPAFEYDSESGDLYYVTG
jgi:hypothetical protein